MTIGAESLTFIDGKTVLKHGRKILATVCGRQIYCPLNKITSDYTPRYSISIQGLSKGCDTLEETIKTLNEWL